jgi:hypothetical protein
MFDMDPKRQLLLSLLVLGAVLVGMWLTRASSADAPPTVPSAAP